MGTLRNGCSYGGKQHRNLLYQRARRNLAIEIGYHSIEELEFLAHDWVLPREHLLEVNDMAEKEVAKIGPDKLYGDIQHTEV